ncbi:MAG: zinc ribbon domain-containing protein [Desulfobacteraceae bacterium]|nr:MAG: zinc ribbon domain-containing protein [Desulfobacteraceae bacterium]
MPIFEFQCDSCGHIMEMLLSANETDLAVCPGCGSRHLKKLLSVPAPQASGGRMPAKASERCCGTAGPPNTCSGPGSCCGRR